MKKPGIESLYSPGHDWRAIAGWQRETAVQTRIALAQHEAARKEKIADAFRQTHALLHSVIIAITMADDLARWQDDGGAS